MKKKYLHWLIISSLLLAGLIWDTTISWQFQHNPHTIKTLARFATQLIDPIWIALLSFSLLLWRKRIFLENACALGIGFASVRILKWVVGRSRPNVLFSEGIYTCHPFSLSSDFQSFPSSHALAIFTLATTCALIWPKWKVGIYLTASILALSRVVLHQHFLTDVLFGALFGLYIREKIGRVIPARLEH